ncbi:MAG: putative colanic acid biosynthesis acetyltransferase [Janthinobacterium lividum]
MALKPLDAAISNPKEEGPSFSLSNRIERALWIMTWGLLASWTPPPMRPWRRFLLRCFGAKMGAGSDVRCGARVWYPRHLQMEEASVLASGVNCYNMAPIHIGAGAIVSQGAHLCAGSHDITSPVFQLTMRPIRIGANAWIAADAFVGPGVDVGEGAVLGARGVAFRSLDAWGVYAGNPAQRIKQRVMRS